MKITSPHVAIFSSARNELNSAIYECIYNYTKNQIEFHQATEYQSFT